MDKSLNINDIARVLYSSHTSEDAAWVGDYFVYGGSGSQKSTVMYFEVPPGKRLGRHHNTAEETHYYVSGSGELTLDSGPRQVSQGDLFLLPEGTVHDLRNTGEENLCVIGFFPEPRVQYLWSEDVWDGKTVTGSPHG